MSALATVAIPTLNAGDDFEQTLAAVRDQQCDGEIELLICDSGSTDRTVSLARRYEARLIEIPRESFSHGGTRNLLMAEARGGHVAFLTQDAVPAADDWLAGLLRGFGLSTEVGLVFGPYRPRPDASLSVSRELTSWFDSFSSGAPRLDVLKAEERSAPASHFLGRLGFFTDANGCVARAAWERVPFRDVAYAEDHLLAQDMLRAGFAKVFVPDAAVTHSHEYSAAQWVRRSFDEARAMREVYGWAADSRTLARNFRGNVVADWRCGQASAASLPRSRPLKLKTLADSVVHHGARTVGSLLGARADRLPPQLIERLSLERRA